MAQQAPWDFQSPLMNYEENGVMDLPRAPAVQMPEAKKNVVIVPPKTRTSSRKNTFTPADDFMSLAETSRNTPENKDSQKSIADLENHLAMVRDQKPDEAGWLKPLLALADSETGSKLLSGYTPGMTAKDKNEQILKYMNDISQRKSDLNKSVLSGISAMKNGTQQTIINTGGAAGNGKNPGLDSLNRATGKEYSDYVQGGGFSKAESNISQLNEIIGELNTKNNLTGGLQAVVPKIAKDIFATESGDVEDRVRNVVQSNLKLLLGSQFTEREGERIIKSYYNTRQDEKTNSKRLSNLVHEMASAAAAKEAAMNWFENNNQSMSGYNGVTRVNVGGKAYDVAPKSTGSTQSSQASPKGSAEPAKTKMSFEEWKASKGHT